MMPSVDILSPANPRVRAAAALRDRRARDRTGRTLVDGGRELARAIEAGAAIQEAFVCSPRLRAPEARAAVGRLASAGVALHECSPAAYEKLAFGDRDEGLVAVVWTPAAELKGLRLPEEPLVVVTEDVEKPGNVGAILRSADGAGADALIAADAATDIFNPNVIRASIGTVFSVPVARASAPDARSWLQAAGIRIVTARVDAPMLYTDADLRGPLAIILGSEAGGLSAAWESPGVEAVRLPMLGVADSLNVSATAAVLLYEARRQRGPRRRDA